MTDKKNDLELEADQLEDIAEGETAVSSEEWQSELPPEDDFHDHEETYAEDALDADAEEAGESVDEMDAQAAEAERAKRGKSVLFGILVVGAVFIGGLAYLQFGSSSAPDGATGRVPLANVLTPADLKEMSQSAGASGTDPKTASTGDVYVGSTARPTSSKDFEAATVIGGTTDILSSTDGATVPVASEPQKTAAVTAPVPPPVAAGVPDVTKPVPAVSVQEMEKSVPEAVTAPPPPALQTEALKPLPVALGTAQPAAVAPSPAMAELETRLKTVTQQVDGLKKSLEEASAQNATLLARVEALQQQKQALEKASVEKAAAVTHADGGKKNKPEEAAPIVIGDSEKVKPVTPETMPQQVSDYLKADSSVAAPAVAQTEKTVAVTQKTKTASRKVASAPKKTRKKGAQSEDLGSKWVLRAATPDAAWVSISRDSMDLRRVTVGESLPGLGRIRSITPNGDRWEVVGEAGTLR